MSRRKTPSLQRTAIIDIGSNTVRLVVYEDLTALSAPTFNEKVHCELARGLSDSGLLNREGQNRSMLALSRFVRLARAMGVARIRAVATAAVREAINGRAFVDRIRRKFRIPVKVLSGTEEARMSAFGLLASVPTADGLFVDLGGGSLELVLLSKGKITKSASLMLGHLVLSERSEGSRKRATNLVERELEILSWLRRLKGKTLYVTGGSWRTIARILLDQTNHPLHIIDGYEVDADKVLQTASILSDLSDKTLLKIEVVSPRRVGTLPFAALVLRALIKAGKPDRVAFSRFGVREGVLLSALPNFPEEMPDLLIEGAAAIGRRQQRFSTDGEETVRWLSFLFQSLGKGKNACGQEKLWRVACHLTDVARFDHPDYRSEHALANILHLPLGGLSHVDRAYIALAIFIRYNGKIDSPLAKPALKLLDAGRLYSANILGLALQLAQAISGGASGLLGKTSLKISRGKLVLRLPRARATYMGEPVERKLKALARTLDLAPQLR